MAYRRRQGISRVSTFKEEIHYPPDDTTFSSSSSSSNANPIPDPGPDLNPNPNPNPNPSSLSSSSSLAAQAIRASAAHRESSLSSAYGDSAFSYAYRGSDRQRSQAPTQYEYTSLKSPTDSKNGFWSILAKKAKSILDDDEQQEMSSRAKPQMLDTSAGGMLPQPYQSLENFRRVDNPKLRKSIDAITSSLNHIGGTIGNAFEEGRTIVENKTADIIQETRKLQIRKKGSNSPMQNQTFGVDGSSGQPLAQTSQETQLKASRDVAMATAAKAKLLLRELKTVKADLAFAKERCAQLEEENKILRENRAKGANPADDDLIRLQLETLLAEKARLAHENSVYARENRFLREIVEYHQLTMQDVVYLDEGIEEVTEVSPITKILTVSPPSTSPPGSPTVFQRRSISASPASKEVAIHLSLDDTAENDLGRKSPPEPSPPTHATKHTERPSDASA